MIALAVLAAIGWGASDYFGGRGSRRTLVFSVLGLVELAGAAMLVPTLLATGTPHWSARLGLAAVAGLGVTIELGVIFTALSRGAAFITAPVGAIGTALAVTVGLVDGDPLTPVIAVGLLCAVVGGGLSAGDEGEGEHSPGRFGLARALVACLIAAAGVAMMQITLHAAGSINPYWAVELEHLSTAVSAGAVVAGIAWRRRRPGPTPPDVGAEAGETGDRLLPARGQLPLLGFVALCGSGGDVAYAAASHGALSTVSAIASLYPIPTIGLGFIGQGRRAGRRQAAGVALALAGAAVLGAVSP